ncbi:hypothetical protein [Ahrensia kielensis]|uniref:hypothetical protein n=1 Tax=Ahrensia kielensis TaxID=76980 RepID=UPI00146D3A6B|nr:hypothetical protein [Ahrensia kielensis]
MQMNGHADVFTNKTTLPPCPFGTLALIKGKLFMVRSISSNAPAKRLVEKTRPWKNLAAILPVMTLALSGCTTSEPVAGPLSGEFESKNATALLQNINSLGLKCWIKSGDKAFRGFALVPELDTRSGTPRILIVHKGKSQGLPQLVIEATGSPVKLQTYGPLTSSPVSTRINSDIIAWNTGKHKC